MYVKVDIKNFTSSAAQKRANGLVANVIDLNKLHNNENDNNDVPTKGKYCVCFSMS